MLETIIADLYRYSPKTIEKTAKYYNLETNDNPTLALVNLANYIDENASSLIAKMEPADITFDIIKSKSEFDQIVGKSLKVLGQGTYGKVVKTSNNYAVKLMFDNDCREIGFSPADLREIAILRYLGLPKKYPNVIPIGPVYIDIDRIKCNYKMSLPLAKGTLDDIIKGYPNKIVPLIDRKKYLYQIFRGLAYCHSKYVWHRDIKPANILSFNDGTLRLADFGLARIFTRVGEAYTSLVVTSWWRPPELFLGATEYTELIDVWSVGVIMLEMMIGNNLLALNTEQEILDRIFLLLGTPNEQEWPDVTSLKKWKTDYNKRSYTTIQKKLDRVITRDAIDTNPQEINFLKKLLTWPNKRISALDALKDGYFDDVRDSINVQYPGTTINKYDCGEALIKEEIPITNTLKLTIRTNLLKRLTYIANYFKFSGLTVGLTFILIDKLFTILNDSNTILNNDRRVLYTNACLLIASKIYEMEIPRMSDYAFLNNSKFTTSELLTFEFQVLQMLKFDILHVSYANYINYLINNVISRQNISTIANRIVTYIPDIDKYTHLEIAYSAIEIYKKRKPKLMLNKCQYLIRKPNKLVNVQDYLQYAK